MKISKEVFIGISVIVTFFIGMYGIKWYGDTYPRASTPEELKETREWINKKYPYIPIIERMVTERDSLRHIIDSLTTPTE